MQMRLAAEIIDQLNCSNTCGAQTQNQRPFRAMGKDLRRITRSSKDDRQIKNAAHPLKPSPPRDMIKRIAQSAVPDAVYLLVAVILGLVHCYPFRGGGGGG